jgi:hypothetical protein
MVTRRVSEALTAIPRLRFGLPLNQQAHSVGLGVMRIQATRSVEGEGELLNPYRNENRLPLHLAVQPPAMAHTAQPPLVPQPDFSLVPQPGPQPCSSNFAKREEATFF